MPIHGVVPRKSDCVFAHLSPRGCISWKSPLPHLSPHESHLHFVFCHHKTVPRANPHPWCSMCVPPHIHSYLIICHIKESSLLRKLWSCLENPNRYRILSFDVQVVVCCNVHHPRLFYSQLHSVILIEVCVDFLTAQCCLLND